MSLAPPFAAARMPMAAAAAMRVCVGMAVGLSPGRCKRAQATVAEILDNRVQRVECVAVLPVLAWFAPGFAGVAAECKVFGNLVAHGCWEKVEKVKELVRVF
ncbi:MAG: hypothetical protein M1830_006287 [Pleopsidium flavum]|nr:MAG: hypothetical protein M1830_006287 [Pleopsidium flavum]